MVNVDLIFRLLKEQGKTQKDLADAIGASTGNVTDWKRGRTKPSAQSLPKIADYLDVPISILLGEQSRPVQAASMKSGFDLSDLSESDIARVEAYIQALRDKNKAK